MGYRINGYSPLMTGGTVTSGSTKAAARMYITGTVNQNTTDWSIYASVQAHINCSTSGGWMNVRKAKANFNRFMTNYSASPGAHSTSYSRWINVSNKNFGKSDYSIKASLNVQIYSTAKWSNSTKAFTLYGTGTTSIISMVSRTASSITFNVRSNVSSTTGRRKIGSGSWVNYSTASNVQANGGGYQNVTVTGLSAGTTYTIYFQHFRNYSGMWTIPASTSQRTLYTYTISYNANGGSGAPASQTKTEGTTLTLSSTKPTKSSTSTSSTITITYNANGGSSTPAASTGTKTITTKYTFSSWNTASGGTGTSYAAGGSYTSNAAATLYAQYTSSQSTSNPSITLRNGISKASTSQQSSTGTLTLTFNANGGSVVPSAQTGTYVNYKTTTYAFSKWNTNSSGTGTSYNASTAYTFSANTTLYAIFTSSVGSEWRYSNPTITISSTVPTRPGYKFLGWNTSSTAVTAAYQPGGKITISANTTLYAIWERTANVKVKTNGVYQMGMLYIKSGGTYHLANVYVKSDGTYKLATIT